MTSFVSQRPQLYYVHGRDFTSSLKLIPYRRLDPPSCRAALFDLEQGYFARGIERRLTESKRLGNLPQRELGARASALAGSLLSLLRWWLDRGAKEAQRAMDELFHRMVWNGLQ
jgi:hypothetical protein